MFENLRPQTPERQAGSLLPSRELFALESSQQSAAPIMVDLKTPHAILNYLTKYLSEDGSPVSDSQARDLFNRTKSAEGRELSRSFNFAYVGQEPSLVQFIREYKHLNSLPDEQLTAIVLGAPSKLRLLESPSPKVIAAAVQGVEKIHNRKLTSDERSYLTDIFVNQPTRAIDLADPRSNILLVQGNPKDTTLVQVDLQPSFLFSAVDGAPVASHLNNIRSLIRSSPTSPKVFLEYEGYKPTAVDLLGDTGLKLDRDPKVENSDRDGVFLFRKKTDGGFENSGVDQYFRSNKPQAIVLSGLNEGFCVGMTALGAYNRGIQTITSGDVVFNSWNAAVESELQHQPFAYVSWTVKNSAQLNSLVKSGRRFIP